MNTQITKILISHIFLRYTAAFLVLGFIYPIVFRDIDPKWWSLLWYPLSFVLMWSVVFFAARNALGKISQEEIASLGRKVSIYRASIIAAIVSVILWLFIRFLGVTILALFMDWIVPVDLSGFIFFLPSSFIQGLLLSRGNYSPLLLFPVQFFGAILFLTGLIIFLYHQKILKMRSAVISAMIPIIIGGMMMFIAQAVYVYNYFTIVPTFYPQERNTDGIIFEEEGEKETPEISGWEKYRNEEFGFEFQYPRYSFYVDPKIIRIDVDNAVSYNGCPYIPSPYESSPTEESIKELLRQGFLKIEKTTINNIPFCLQEFNEAGSGAAYSARYYVTKSKSGGYFAVNFVIRDYEDTGITPEVLNKFLSTFRFLESEQMKVNEDEGMDKFILLSPNGREIWRVGNQYEVKWISKKIPVDSIEGVAIFLADTESSPWEMITIAKDVSPSPESYLWRIPTDIKASAQYKILITASIKGVTKMGLTDQTDETFTIIK